MQRALLVAIAALVAAFGSAAAPNRHLLVVVDGLRPDYVKAELMPHLTALGKRGVVFARHHSVYPTVTRVNASSISTGTYPERHGLLGNSVFFPRVDPSRFLDTSDRAALMKVAAAEGNLLMAPTLAESLETAGRKMLVVSSGSPGSAFLNNHKLAGGAILHYGFVLPDSMRDAMNAIGPAPPESAADDARDRYAVDAFLRVGVPRVDPSVTVMWLGALDSTAHEKGIGAPETVAVLRHVDSEIKRVEDGLRAAGLLDSYNIWVTSDHGFSTYTGGVNLGELLKPFAGTLADGSPRIVSGGGAIYVRDSDQAAVTAITKVLQRTPRVGAIFTPAIRGGSFDGQVPGTLSFDVARWAHPRSAQILFSPDWSDAPNAHGIRGSSASGGTAGHGSSSPWDIHNTLIAAGPDLKRGVTIDTPSANVDFAPTFLHLLGLPIPSSMQGRALDEALAGAATVRAGAVRKSEHTVATPDRAYTVTATFSTITSGGREYRYLDQTKVVRK